jgi:hypothetical protein
MVTQKNKLKIEVTIDELSEILENMDLIDIFDAIKDKAERAEEKEEQSERDNQFIEMASKIDDFLVNLESARDDLQEIVDILMG